MFKAIATLLVLAVSAAAQINYLFVNPGDNKPLTGCLYNTQGHRVYIANVPIEWSGSDTAYSGGHNHPDGGRPLTCLTASGCTIYQDHVTLYTNSQGCSTVQAKAPWYTGEYQIYATPAAPYVSGFEVDLEVRLTGLGAPRASGVYVFWPDSAHPNNNWVDTIAYNDMYYAAAQYAVNTQTSMTVYRAGNYQGGFLDTFSYWLSYPSITEMHEDAQEFDAVTSSNAATSQLLWNAMRDNHCSPSVLNIPGVRSLYHGACY